MDIELSKDSYRLMNFLKKNGKTHVEEILRKFPDDKYATTLQLSRLSEPAFRVGATGNPVVAIKNTSMIEQEFQKIKNGYRTDFAPTGYYSLTPVGLLAVRNYRSKRYKNALLYLALPFLVALVEWLLNRLI